MNKFDLKPGRREEDWIINLPVTDASSGIVIKDAVPDYRYGISQITITTTKDKKWIKFKNGNDDFIGPLELGKYNPITLDFKTTVYCDTGNSLSIQTEDEFELYVLIHGKTCFPIPSTPLNPFPANNATGVSTSAELSWESEFQSMNYNVYFGTDMNMELVSTQVENSYIPSLESSTKYYWRIDEFLDGNKAKGELWTFTTGE